jgi:hypothetical protein
LSYAGRPSATIDRIAPLPVPENWNPRCEAHFERRWLTHLLGHFGEWCHASDAWEPADEHQRYVLRQRAWEVVEAAKRLGLFIESDPLLGYRVTGHDDLPKYLHLHERSADAPHGEVPGQLTLAECVGVE